MGMRSNVLKVAKSQIGLAEPTGDDKYIKWYNSVTGSKFAMNVPWCAMFTSWTLRQAGVPESLLPNFASCSVALAWAKKQKIWYSRLTNHIPKPGEVILFDWEVDGKQDHVGIVETVTANQITTIEGNTRDCVDRRTYSRTSKVIMGYIDVQYTDEADCAVVAPAATKKIATARDVQQYIVDTYKISIVVDGIWGPASKKAMAKCVQTAINKYHGGHLVIDGIFGYASKKSMPIIRKNASGELVRLIQMCLLVAGFTVDVTGKVDTATLSVIKKYQTKKGLVVDGEVGPNTMVALLK